MLIDIDAQVLDERRHGYLLRAVNLYRLALAATLSTLFLLVEDKARFFNTSQPDLFLFAIWGYTGCAALFLLTSLARWPNLNVQAHLQAVIEIGVLTFMIYASGGMGSHLMTVLVMAIAANAILLPMSSGLSLAILALLLAVLASLMAPEMANRPPLLSFDFLPDHYGLHGIPLRLGFPNSQEWSRLGVFGLVLLTVAFTTHALADRARKSEALADRRARQLQEIAELNEAIVHHLQSGILVARPDGTVRLMNETARLLLHAPDVPPTTLALICPALAERLEQWHQGAWDNPQPLRIRQGETEILPEFTHLGVAGLADVLIFLEDADRVAHRLQQIKLAALGRLTASIAHELRNPLAAIHHAAQLLQETAAAPRLVQIVLDHTQRANAIIREVLDVSRRDKAEREVIALAPFLQQFAEEFAKTHTPAPRLVLQVAAHHEVCFDPRHLRQILWNLCQNACLHGQPADDAPLTLVIAVAQDRQRLFIDVDDFGPGIPPGAQRKLFEPFFTTRAQGTGLGLYISRELCEANRARLSFLTPDHPGSRFRLTAQAARLTESPTPCP